jgi:hypothetical protein
MNERNPDRVMSILGHIMELRRRLIASISVALIVPSVSDPKGRTDTVLLCEVWNALEQLIDFFVAPSNKKPATQPPAKDGGAGFIYQHFLCLNYNGFIKSYVSIFIYNRFYEILIY